MSTTIASTGPLRASHVTSGLGVAGETAAMVVMCDSLLRLSTPRLSDRHPEALPGLHKRVHARLDALWAGEPRRMNVHRWCRLLAGAATGPSPFEGRPRGRPPQGDGTTRSASGERSGYCR